MEKVSFIVQRFESHLFPRSLAPSPVRLAWRSDGSFLDGSSFASLWRFKINTMIGDPVRVLAARFRA